MSGDTLTTWTCLRCKTQVVSEHGDIAPIGWEPIDFWREGWHEEITCGDCHDDLLVFLDNEKPIEPRVAA